jgi:hypothetical protein
MYLTITIFRTALTLDTFIAQTILDYIFLRNEMYPMTYINTLIL